MVKRYVMSILVHALPVASGFATMIVLGVEIVMKYTVNILFTRNVQFVTGLYVNHVFLFVQFAEKYLGKNTKSSVTHVINGSAPIAQALKV